MHYILYHPKLPPPQYPLFQCHSLVSRSISVELLMSHHYSHFCPCSHVHRHGHKASGNNIFSPWPHISSSDSSISSVTVLRHVVAAPGEQICRCCWVTTERRIKTKTFIKTKMSWNNKEARNSAKEKWTVNVFVFLSCDVETKDSYWLVGWCR